MPADLLKSIKKITQELTVHIDKLQKTNEKIAKNDDEKATLTQGSYPKAVRSYHPTFESKFLDKTKVVGKRFELQIPDGKSVREAKELLHRYYLAKERELDNLVLTSQRDEYKEQCKRTTFIEKCLAQDERHEEAWSTLGLDLEDGECTIHGPSAIEL